MEWDLVTERNIQLFIKLAGLSGCSLAPCMSWRQLHHDTHLNYQNGRIHLSQIFPHSLLDEQLLSKALSDWRIANYHGIPQRLFQLRQGIAISCSPPPGSSAEFWLLLHRRQIAFLESQCIPA